MIRVLGGPKRLCDGLTRRDLLHVGSLGLLGLGLAGVAAWRGAGGRDAPAVPAGSARRSRASCCSSTGRPASSRRSTPSPTPRSEIRGEFGVDRRRASRA